MGLFDSEEQVYVGTSISKVNDYAKYSPINRTGYVKHLANQQGVLPNTMDTAIVSLGIKVPNYYRLAVKGCPWGIPSAKVFSLASSYTIAGEKLTEYLTTLLGTSSFVIDYYYLGNVNYSNQAYITLISNHTYDYLTNTISGFTGQPNQQCFLTKLDVKVSQATINKSRADYFTVTGSVPTYFVPDGTVALDYISVVANYKYYVGTLTAATISSPHTTYSPTSYSYYTVSASVFDPSKSYTVKLYSKNSVDPPSSYAEIGSKNITTSTGGGLIYFSLTHPSSVQTINVKAVITNINNTSETLTTNEITISFINTGGSVFQESTPSDSFDNLGLVETFGSFIVGDGSDLLIADDGKEHLMYGYHLTSTSNITHVNYLIGSGIVKLDEILNTDFELDGNFLPRIYFRDNFTRIVEGNSIYSKSKQLARSLGMNYEQINDSLHSTEERSQSDLDLIHSSFIQFAAEADSQIPEVIKYNYEFFNKYGHELNGTNPGGTELFANLDNSALVIRDDKFKITVSAYKILNDSVTGSIGEVGSYSFTTEDIQLVEELFTEESDQVQTRTVTYKGHVYKKQLTETSYRTITVLNLRLKYYVEGEHSSVSAYLKDAEDPLDLIYLPIDYELVKDWNTIARDSLYFHSMLIVNNSKQVVKVKWYQKEIWQDIFQIIAIVLILYGITVSIEFLATLETAAAIAGMTVTQYLLVTVLGYLGDLILVKVFVKAVGIDNAFIAALVLFVVTGYMKLDLGVNAVIKIGTFNVLQLGQAILAEVNSVLASQVEKLSEEVKLFTEESQEILENLDKLSEEAFKELDVMAQTYLSEKPSEFYARTLNTDPTYFALSMPRNYVDMALMLPKTI